jgi:sec-independent protein translocase protein TatA
MAIGPLQILIIAIVIVLLFGASRFAALGSGLALGIKNFREGLRGDDKRLSEPGK